MAREISNELISNTPRMFERQFVDELAERIAAKLRPVARSERWPELMSIETAATYMDRTPNAIKHLIESKILPCCQIDRRIQVRRLDIDRLLERKTA